MIVAVLPIEPLGWIRFSNAFGQRMTDVYGEATLYPTQTERWCILIKYDGKITSLFADRFTVTPFKNEYAHWSRFIRPSERILESDWLALTTEAG